MSHIRKMMSLLLICVMTSVMSGLAAIAAPAGAASGPALSKKTVTVAKGGKKTIRLKNAGSGVVWTSSNKKIVRIVKKKDKTGGSVIFKGLRKGRAAITAKYAGKTYSCRVTVTDGSDIEIRPLSSSSVNRAKAYARKKGGRASNEQFRTAVTDFSVELFKNVSQTDADRGKRDNVLISPDSVATALAMLELGSAGNTREEMKTVLGGGMAPADYCSFLAGMNDRLESKKRIIFRQSNSIWARKGAMKVSRDFLKKNRNYFDADFYEAPFNSRTVRDMNNWVYNNSCNMILSVIDRLSLEDRMVLINTTVFEGSWEVPFAYTSKGRFTGAGGEQKDVTMLRETGYYDYFTMNEAGCFTRRYRGGSVSFVGMLPPEDIPVDDFIQSMSGSSFRNAWRSRSRERVRLTMPEFRYDYDTELDPVLRSMGMNEAFTPDADFSRMGRPSLMVDRVLHKTHIELDRNGTRAAAVTAITAKATAVLDERPPIEINMNRPFVYAVVDTKTGIPLFMGCVRTL